MWPFKRKSKYISGGECHRLLNYLLSLDKHNVYISPDGSKTQVASLESDNKIPYNWLDLRELRISGFMSAVPLSLAAGVSIHADVNVVIDFEPVGDSFLRGQGFSAVDSKEILRRSIIEHCDGSREHVDEYCPRIKGPCGPRTLTALIKETTSKLDFMEARGGLAMKFPLMTNYRQLGDLIRSWGSRLPHDCQLDDVLRNIVRKTGNAWHNTIMNKAFAKSALYDEINCDIVAIEEIHDVIMQNASMGTSVCWYSNHSKE